MNRQTRAFALLAVVLALSACSSGLDDRFKAMESRIAALEQANAELRAQLDNRQGGGGLDDRGQRAGLDDRGTGLDDRATGDGK